MKQGPSDQHAVAAFLRGEHAAVGEIRAAIQVVVRSFQFADRESERDLIQEVMGRVVQNLGAGQFRGEASLRTYVQSVAKYACLEHIRRQRSDVRTDFEAVPSEARWAEPEGAFLLHEEHLRNLEAFAALPEDTRELLRLLFVERLSYGDAARRLGVSESAIKSRVHRVRMMGRELAAARKPAARRGPTRVER